MPLRENNHMGRNCDTPLRQSFQKIWTTGRNHSDRDPRFAAHAFQELLKLLNIKSNLTTAYHPQSDGATKRVNQEIKAYLSIYCTSHPEDWLHSLSTLEFTHNNRRHAERVHSPFELIQGDNPISVPITFSHTKSRKR
jgi:transposase InsO family protein